MNSLYELAENNFKLRFLDTNSGVEFSLHDLRKISFNENFKCLFFVYLDNSISSIEIFWSIMRSSHCFVMLPPNITVDQKKKLENIYKPNFVYDPQRELSSGYYLNHDFELPIFQASRFYNHNIHNDIKVLLSTSGTTGSPKFVKLSEENIIANAQSIVKYLPINGSDITPLNLPIYYSYGLSILTSNSLKGGRIVCSADDIFQKKFWDDFTEYGFTSFAGVPFVYEMLYRIGFVKKNYPSLRYMTQAGGKLQDNILKSYADYCRKNRIDFYVMYGQTEATARMSYLNPSDLFNKLGSIGKPIPGGKFIIDNNTSELCFQGKNIFGGYVDSGDDLKIFKQPEILATGDLARVDNDGFYFITGRVKRIVKLFGSRVNLDEVESLIANNLNYVVKCIGVSDKYLVIFYNDLSLPDQVLNQFIFDNLKLHASVIKYFFTEKYPLTDNKKINYKELLNLYESSRNNRD